MGDKRRGMKTVVVVVVATIRVMQSCGVRNIRYQTDGTKEIRDWYKTRISSSWAEPPYGLGGHGPLNPCLSNYPCTLHINPLQNPADHDTYKPNMNSNFFYLLLFLFLCTSF